MDVLPRLKLLNSLTALTFLLFQLVRSFTAKGIYLKEARSGFEPESLVHFRT
jgi:hypothetical protein